MQHINSSVSLVCFITLSVMMLAKPSALNAQVNPPRPVTLTVNNLQELDFGTFAVTGATGGTVTVTSAGDRSRSGDIVLIGNSYSCGVFRVNVATGSRLFMFGGLTGMLYNGSYSMSIDLDQQTFPPLINTVFTTLNASTDFYLGATLHAGPPAANPPGTYSGTYEIIINHE